MWSSDFISENRHKVEYRNVFLQPGFALEGPHFGIGAGSSGSSGPRAAIGLLLGFSNHSEDTRPGTTSSYDAAATAAPLLGPHEHSAFLRGCCFPGVGLRFNPKFSGARTGRNLDPGRRGEQLGGIRGAGSGGRCDFGRHFLCFSPHRASQDGALDVDNAYQRHWVWSGVELFAEIEPSLRLFW